MWNQISSPYRFFHWCGMYWVISQLSRSETKWHETNIYTSQDLYYYPPCLQEYEVSEKYINTLDLCVTSEQATQQCSHYSRVVLMSLNHWQHGLHLTDITQGQWGHNLNIKLAGAPIVLSWNNYHKTTKMTLQLW